MSPRTRIILAWTPAVLYTLLIWWLSSQVLDIAFMSRVPFQDKGVHFLEYGALTFFIAFAHLYTWPARTLAGPLVAAAFTTALGLLDELHQGFVVGRFSDIYDLLADATGALIAALAFLAVRAVQRALSRRNDPLIPRTS
ncbi:MAG TPA: VanZ family protein [Polyangiales bacterium]|nr:VanZ family protein [Polyangiales bacterium]